MTQVITARGEHLNMAELKLKARRPLMQPEVSSTVQRQEQPVRQANIKGFMPSLEGVARRLGPDQQPVEVTPVEGPSMADYTGVTIDRLKHLEQRPENATDVANEALNDIITDLNKFNHPVADDTPKGRRSRQS